MSALNKPEVDKTDVGAYSNNEGDRIRHRIANFARVAAAYDQATRDPVTKEAIPSPGAGIEGIQRIAAMFDAAFGGPAHSSKLEAVALDGYFHYVQFGKARLAVQDSAEASRIVRELNSGWRKIGSEAILGILSDLSGALSDGPNAVVDLVFTGCWMADQRNYIPVDDVTETEIRAKIDKLYSTVCADALSAIRDQTRAEATALWRHVKSWGDGAAS